MGSSAAKRQRLYAERQREGLIVVRCVVVEQDVIAVLQDAGFLDRDDPPRQMLADALSRWIYQQMTRQVQELWPMP